MTSRGSFQAYLRQEVDEAAKRYEKATKRVFALTRGPEIKPGPQLLQAIESLSEATTLYINTLRRLAHYSAHHAREKAREQLTSHA
jgi:hypothetical protein